MRYYTRPLQRSFPFTRERLMWSRVKRVGRRMAASEWVHILAVWLLALAALWFMGPIT